MQGRRLGLLAVCAALLSVCGCGHPDAAAGKIQLVLAVPADIQNEPIYRAVIQDFEARHPEIHVKLLTLQYDYYTKALIMIAGRNAPDLFWMGENFGDFASRGTILDVSAQIAHDLPAGELLPQAIDWYRSGGKQYGVAFGIDLDFIAYNPKLFDEAAVPYPTDDWNVDDFLDKARRLTKGQSETGEMQYGFRGEFDPSAFGAAIIAEDGSRALCNTPEMIRCLQFNLDLIHTWKVAPPSAGGEKEALDIHAAFRRGQAAMMHMYTWDLPFLREQMAGMDWNIVNIPRIARRAHWASTQAIVISADTQHPAEAWALSREFLGVKFQRAISGFILPANLRVAREVCAAQRAAPANLAALLKATDSLCPNPRTPNLEELTQRYYDAVASVNELHATPAEAMARAAKAIDQGIERNRKHRP